MTGPPVRHFRTLAAYNGSANRRLYEACARLGDTERKVRKLSFFGKIYGTLNHVMVGGRVWLAEPPGLAKVSSLENRACSCIVSE